MAITNGYCTLAQLKQRLKDMATYTASTISFTASSKTITDTTYGLGRFVSGDIIIVSGSTSNDGYYTVDNADANNTITVTESLTDESASASITISQQASKAGGVSPDDDAMLEEYIEEASRWIDDYTGMTFFAESETRSFVVGKDTEGSLLWLDKPLLSVTTLTNGDDDVIESTEYVLIEINGPPYDQIKLRSDSSKSWQYTTGADVDFIEVAGTWGNYSTTPTPIRSACTLMASRLWKRKDSIFGVAGNTQLGQLNMQIPVDKTIIALLEGYVMPWGYTYGK
jgi:hypothetical protein